MTETKLGGLAKTCGSRAKRENAATVVKTGSAAQLIRAISRETAAVLIETNPTRHGTYYDQTLALASCLN